MSEDAFGGGGSKQAACCMEAVGEAQTNAPIDKGAVKSKKPRKPRSETNRENYLKRMSRDMPVKLWLCPEAFEIFESGRKSMAMSRSEYGNVQFGQRDPVPSKESCSTVETPANGHSEGASLAELAGEGEESTVPLSEGVRKPLTRLARYSKGAGRVLSEGEILSSLVNGVSPDMLVWMLKVSVQRNEALVDVFRSQLSLAKAENSKDGAAAEEGTATQSLN